MQKQLEYAKTDRNPVVILDRCIRARLSNYIVEVLSIFGSHTPKANALLHSRDRLTLQHIQQYVDERERQGKPISRKLTSPFYTRVIAPLLETNLEARISDVIANMDRPAVSASAPTRTENIRPILPFQSRRNSKETPLLSAEHKPI